MTAADRIDNLADWHAALLMDYPRLSAPGELYSRSFVENMREASRFIMFGDADAAAVYLRRASDAAATAKG